MDKKLLGVLRTRLRDYQPYDVKEMASIFYLREMLCVMIDALLEEPKPVATDLARSSYVFDMDFSCVSCQQVLSHLIRGKPKTKVRLSVGVDKKTWHFLEKRNV